MCNEIDKEKYYIP